MRRLLSASIVALVVLAAGRAPAADYPVKPIRILVPFPPGGAADAFARLTGQRLQEQWNAQVVIEPRPGAGGIIATELAVKSPPDGYTFLIVTVGHAVNPSLFAKLPYDTLLDFAPIGVLANSPNVLVVHPSVPARSAKELVALARARPGQLNYGTGGNATTAHVAAALLSSFARIEMTHVPYKGSPLAMQDLVAGRLDLMLDQITSSIGFIRAGRLRPLAVTPAKRTPQLPEVPTLAETGVPGYDFTAWWMFLAPAKTPPDIVARFNKELAAAGADAGFRERLARLGADPALPAPPAETAQFVRREMERFAKMVRDTGMRAQ